MSGGVGEGEGVGVGVDLAYEAGVVDGEKLLLL